MRLSVTSARDTSNPLQHNRRQTVWFACQKPHSTYESHTHLNQGAAPYKIKSMIHLLNHVCTSPITSFHSFLITKCSSLKKEQITEEL